MTCGGAVTGMTYELVSMTHCALVCSRQNQGQLARDEKK